MACSDTTSSLEISKVCPVQRCCRTPSRDRAPQGPQTLAGSLNPRAASAKTSLAEPVSAFRRCFIVPPSPCTIWQWRNGKHAFSICPCHDLPFLCRADSRAANDNTELSCTMPLAAGATNSQISEASCCSSATPVLSGRKQSSRLDVFPPTRPASATTSPHHSVESERSLPYRVCSDSVLNPTLRAFGRCLSPSVFPREKDIRPSEG